MQKKYAIQFLVIVCLLHNYNVDAAAYLTYFIPGPAKTAYEYWKCRDLEIVPSDSPAVQTQKKESLEHRRTLFSWGGNSVTAASAVVGGYGFHCGSLIIGGSGVGIAMMLLLVNRSTLARIEAQIHVMHEEMNRRFTSVDQSLQVLQGDLVGFRTETSANFKEVRSDIAVLRGDIRGVQEQDQKHHEANISAHASSLTAIESLTKKVDEQENKLKGAMEEGNTALAADLKKQMQKLEDKIHKELETMFESARQKHEAFLVDKFTTLQARINNQLDAMHKRLNDIEHNVEAAAYRGTQRCLIEFVSSMRGLQGRFPKSNSAPASFTYYSPSPSLASSPLPALTASILSQAEQNRRQPLALTSNNCLQILSGSSSVTPVDSSVVVKKKRDKRRQVEELQPLGIGQSAFLIGQDRSFPSKVCGGVYHLLTGFPSRSK